MTLFSLESKYCFRVFFDFLKLVGLLSLCNCVILPSVLRVCHNYYANLPLEYLEINFKYLDDETREISFIPHGEKYQKMIEEIL